MGISVTTLGAGLQQGLYPFGNATKGKKDTYRYIIIRSRFEKYMSGADMQEYSEYNDKSLADSDNDEPLITVTEAAKILGLSQTTLYWGLRQKLYPFGNATRNKSEEMYYQHWRYIIFRRRFDIFVNAGDMKASDKWQQIKHYAIYQLKEDSTKTPIILCRQSITDDIMINDANFGKQIIDVYDKRAKDAIKNDFELTQGQKLREQCEKSDAFYEIHHIMKICKCSYTTVMKYCQDGKIKAVNPDGRKWFIDIEAFDKSDVSKLPRDSENSFRRYLKKKYG